LNEIEWLSHHDPVPLLEYLRGRPAPQRKLRLFAVACCRQFESAFPGPHFNEALEIAEQYADAALEREDAKSFEPWKLISESVVVFNERDGSLARAVYHSAQMAQSILDLETNELLVDLHKMAASVSRLLIDASQGEDRIGNSYALRAGERLRQADLIRDLFGNPFRAVVHDPRWLTATVIDLSRAIYQERAFERMPILADALIDAGCDSEEILSHCRAPTLHARGCWVIDLLSDQAGRKGIGNLVV